MKFKEFMQRQNRLKLLKTFRGDRRDNILGILWTFQNSVQNALNIDVNISDTVSPSLLHSEVSLNYKVSRDITGCDYISAIFYFLFL